MTLAGAIVAKSLSDVMALYDPVNIEPGTPYFPLLENYDSRTLFSDSEQSVNAIIGRWIKNLQAGVVWTDALFSAIGDWPLAEEFFQGRHYSYVLANEAFDWLLLAERLINVSTDLVPNSEAERLLFNGELPIEVTEKEIEHAFGQNKYRAHLNYFYGVVVEEALRHSVEDDLIKQNSVKGFRDSPELDSGVFENLYGLSFRKLMSEFYKGKNRRLPVKHRISDLKEFSYWCFRRRIVSSDSSKVASDTKKGLERLNHLRSKRL